MTALSERRRSSSREAPARAVWQSAERGDGRAALRARSRGVPREVAGRVLGFPRMRASRLVTFFVPTLALAACGTAGPARAPDAGGFRVIGVGANADPTVRSARLLPEAVDETQGYGTESGGGVRAITAGLRVVSTRDGSIVAA